MTIINQRPSDRGAWQGTFYDLLDTSIRYTVIKSSMNSAPTEWMAVAYGPYQNITSAELGQSLIAYCQANQ